MRQLFKWLVTTLIAINAPHVLAAPQVPSRYAVVIANSHYPNLGVLRNPLQDGQLVSAAFKAAGYRVEFLKDLTDEQFRLALRQVARNSAASDVTIVYYAGHGAQVAGTNYLLPTDITLPQQEDDIRFSSVSADDVLSVIKSPYKVLILDACRDNPVLSKVLVHGRSASYRRGLASTTPTTDSTGGIFIAYSTQADAIALDGDGTYSPFAESFAKYVESPTSIDDMFALVTRDVLKRTNGFQRPFKYASLDTIFCLTDNCPILNSKARASSSFDQPTSELGADSYKLLSSSGRGTQRGDAELLLKKELMKMLPTVVTYGTIKAQDESTVPYAFEPATVQYSGRQVHVTATAGKMIDGRPVYDKNWESVYLMDCDRHKFIQQHYREGANVVYYTNEQQESNAIQIAATGVAHSLEILLCTSPIGFTPIWLADSLEWTDVGSVQLPGPPPSTLRLQIAPSLYVGDSLDASTKFVLTKAKSSVVDSLGASDYVGWMGVHCDKREYTIASSFGRDADGAVVSILGADAVWQKFNDASPAANMFVIMCDKPNG